MKLQSANWMLMLVSLGLTSCIAPYEANNFPQYPFSLKVYYDGKCEARVVRSAEISINVEGVLRRSIVNMYPIEDGKHDRLSRSLGLTCYFSGTSRLHAGDPNYLMSELVLDIYFDRFIENMDEFIIEKKLIVERYESEPGDLHDVVQLAEKSLVFDLTKFSHRKKTQPFLYQSELPFDYYAVAYGKLISPLFPRPFKFNKICSGDAADFYSKDGVLIINAAKNYQPDEIYLEIKGNMVVGGTTCF